MQVKPQIAEKEDSDYDTLYYRQPDEAHEAGSQDPQEADDLLKRFPEDHF